MSRIASDSGLLSLRPYSMALASSPAATNETRIVTENTRKILEGHEANIMKFGKDALLGEQKTEGCQSSAREALAT